MALSRSWLLLLLPVGVDGRSCLSKDRPGEPGVFRPPSIIRLMSRTVPGCSDCMRRWPLIMDFSGEPSWTRLARDGTTAFSRARSLSAAWADWMAILVPARDEKLGDCGFKGNGGGARSGSELSHL